MKVVLLALDGDEARARNVLQETFRDAEVESVSRTQIESAGVAERIRLVRQLQPEIFAISMESFDWQRGQTLLSIFAGASGAKEIVTIDASGRIRRESNLNVFVRAPWSLTGEAISSAWAIFQTRRHLRRLESAVKSLHVKAAPARRTPQAPEFVFLRATPGPGTQAGGASTHINGFINAVQAEGARVKVISNDRIAGLDHTKVPLTVVPLEGTGLTRSAFDLRNNLVFTAGALRAIGDPPPDLIYQRYSRFTWAGVAASLLFKRPLFLEYNGSEVWVGKYWDEAGMFDLLERFERLNLLAAVRIFVVSAVERNNLLRAGVEDHKIVVNPNGVDVDTFRPGVGGRSVRTELGISNDEPLVGFVGTFGPWHGVLELARAIALIPREVPLKFLLVGAGKLKSEMEQTIREAGLFDRVIFTGSVAHERVPALLDACDILVAPHVPLADGSDFFGSPTKLFEYMAMGKGIVASRLGQIGDVLTDEETALLIEPGDPNQLAEGIVRLSRSRELRERLGEKARQVAVERYTWRHNARRVLDTYNSQHGTTRE
ncbi:MAG TPA: glycosyltransferase family 4 protein [Pyrinomonadaceae bacterium]|nr:glycosyltransferase family 4 protein [Pyrinomonadaceae bacterium]